MWLAASGGRDNQRAHRRVGHGGSWSITLILSRPGVKVSIRGLLIRVRITALSVVIMGRHLGLKQCNGLATTFFAEVVKAETGTLARMHRKTALEVRQSKRALSVATVSGA